MEVDEGGRRRARGHNSSGGKDKEADVIEMINALGKLTLQNAQQGRQLAAAVSVVHLVSMEDPVVKAVSEVGDN